MSKTNRSPDHLLAPVNHRGLNEQFYRADPVEYFQARLKFLVLTASAPERFGDVLAEPVKLGSVSLERGPDSPEDARRDRRVATIEAETLFHHVAEALLRLYLAHEPIPPCSWLELSRLRRPGDFKRKLENRFIESKVETTREATASIFYLARTPQDLAPVAVDEEVWARAVDFAEEYLRHFARRLLNNADAYNSVKHGFAVQAGEPLMKYGDLIQAEGPGFSFLRVMESQGSKRWFQSVAWVDIEVTAALILVAIQLIDLLWSTARIRYRVDPPTELRFLERPPLAEVLNREPGISVDGLNMELLYYRDEASRKAAEHVMETPDN